MLSPLAVGAQGLPTAGWIWGIVPFVEMPEKREVTLSRCFKFQKKRNGEAEEAGIMIIFTLVERCVHSLSAFFFLLGKENSFLPLKKQSLQARKKEELGML